MDQHSFRLERSAQAGLNWLSADPPNLEEVRRALDGIASDGKRAAEIVIRLRALAKNALKVDAAAAPRFDAPRWLGRCRLLS
jgi:hypothetical protein